MGHATSPMESLFREPLAYGQTDSRQEMSRAFTGALNAAVPREAESTGSGGLEDPRQRPTAATMDPGDADDAASLKARQKPPKRAWRHDQRIGARSMATIVTTDNLTICPGLHRGSPGSPFAW